MAIKRIRCQYALDTAKHTCIYAGMNPKSEIRNPKSKAVQFSIVIPVYNGESTLGETLDAISRLQGAAYEVVVVDDASTDGTAELAERMGARVVRSEVNHGPATARTLGAQVARGVIVVFTDDDVWVAEDLLQRLERAFAESGADAVQGAFNIECPHENLCSQYKNLYNRHVILRLPDWIDTTFTSVTAVKRDVFFTCGGFDTNIRDASIEDRTLGRNLVHHGYRIRLDRCIEVIHNKRLSLYGLLRNQYRRSRDLARLLLRNRMEKKASDLPEPALQVEPPPESKGRFGTNAPTTMARLPAAYTALCLLLAGLLPMPPIVTASLVGCGLLALAMFVLLAWPLTRAFAAERGWGFALQTLPVNLLDAYASGAGVAWGMFSFLLLGKRY